MKRDKRKKSEGWRETEKEKREKSDRDIMFHLPP